MQLRQLHIPSDDWEERANKVLSNFNFLHPDEIDMYDICWRYGIKIMPFEREFVDLYIEETEDYESISQLNAVSIPYTKGRRGIIFLKPDLDSIEKKILLAEEFSHIYSITLRN